MSVYKQLTREQRYQIYAMKKAGLKQSAMAAVIGVDKSTLSRELKRNCGQRGYRAKQANEMAAARQHHSSRISAETWALVESKLEEQLSPEQVSGWLVREKESTVSHERIYQYLYENKRLGGDLHLHLRCQKKRRKRYGSNDRRGQLPNRVCIEKRPAIVDRKKRIGDWEADTIIGKNGQQAIVSLTERKSKLTLLRKVDRKTAEAVQVAITDLMGTMTEKVHTVTSDNGREFANHQEIAKELGAKFYFAHPYRSWERGLNENTNGLVRQYFPKKFDFSKITDDDVQFVQDRLNDRPRKTLGYASPNEVFFKPSKVALRT